MSLNRAGKFQRHLWELIVQIILVYLTSLCVNWAFFGTRFTRVLKWPTRAKKGPIYTQTS
jgi:hypothetical protein